MTGIRRIPLRSASRYGRFGERDAKENEISESISHRAHSENEVSKAEDVESASSRSIPARRNVAGA